MKQKKNNIDCTPTKQEEGAINELISWCENPMQLPSSR